MKRVLIWLEEKISEAEQWVRKQDKKYALKVEHRSPCIHCGRITIGSIAEGFTHEDGIENCRLENMNVKATPRSLFGNKDNK